MSDAFAFLGLRPDADERAIKRAYALRVKQTRPDDDADGFQQLHDAYQAALYFARLRDAQAQPVDEPGSTGKATPQIPSSTRHAPTSAPAVNSYADAPQLSQALDSPYDEEHFDFAAFYAAITQLAETGDTVRLLAALKREPALWSLDAKARIGQQLFASLDRGLPPMPPPSFETLLEFFDLDHVLVTGNTWVLPHLRRQLQLSWEMDPAHPGRTRYTQQLLSELTGHWNLTGLLWHAITPNVPARMRAVVVQLAEGLGYDLPPPFEPKRIAFWRAAGDRSRMSWPRIAVGAARCATLFLALPLVYFAIWSMSSGELSFIPFARGYLTFPLGVTALWVAYLFWVTLSNWQAADENPIARDRWWRLAFIPALAAGALFAHAALPTSMQIVVLTSASLAAVLALVRYGRRARMNVPGWLQRHWWRFLVLAPIAGRIIADIVFSFALLPECVGLVALAFWSADLWKQRAHLRIS